MEFINTKKLLADNFNAKFPTIFSGNTLYEDLIVKVRGATERMFKVKF